MQTAWHDFLRTQGATLSPAHCAFAAPHTEAEAAADATIVVPLSHLGVLEVGGADATSFLHALTSNEVKKLAAQRAQLNSLNSPKGRMLASFTLWRGGEHFRLALAADQLAAMQKKFALYVLRSKVQIQDAGTQRTLLGLSGAQARQMLAAVGLPAPAAAFDVAGDAIHVIALSDTRFMLDLPLEAAEPLWLELAAAGARPAGTAAWQWLDICAGLPLVSAANQDEYVAQMINYELLGGVDFKKGCYPGQEIVARTHYLGRLKKRLFRVHLEAEAAPDIGTDLYSPEFGEQSCGKIFAIAAAPEGGYEALAVIQIGAVEGGELHFGQPDGPRLALRELPYAVD